MASLVSGEFKRVGKNGVVVGALPSYFMRSIGSAIRVHSFTHVSVYDNGFQGISELIQVSDARGHKDVVIPPSLLGDDETILRVFYEDSSPINYLNVEEGDTLVQRVRKLDDRTQIISHAVDIVLGSGLFVPGFVFEDYSKASNPEFPKGGKPEKLTAVTDRCLEALLVDTFRLERNRRNV